MNPRKRTIADAFTIAGRDDRKGRVAILVICARLEPPKPIGSVRQDPRLGFILRTGGSRGEGKTLTAIIGSHPTSQYRYPCPRCGEHAPDPALLAEKIQAYRTSGEQQKLILS